MLTGRDTSCPEPVGTATSTPSCRKRTSCTDGYRERVNTTWATWAETAAASAAASKAEDRSTVATPSEMVRPSSRTPSGIAVEMAGTESPSSRLRPARAFPGHGNEEGAGPVGVPGLVEIEIGHDHHVGWWSGCGGSARGGGGRCW